mgnify:CR=1 FL=1
MRDERFIIKKGEKFCFKLDSRRLVFPLEFKMDYMNKGKEAPLYEIFVSSTNHRPSSSSHDIRSIEPKFFINYGGRVDWIYFCINAVSDMDVKVRVSSGECNFF